MCACSTTRFRAELSKGSSSFWQLCFPAEKATVAAPSGGGRDCSDYSISENYTIKTSSSEKPPPSRSHSNSSHGPPWRKIAAAMSTLTSNANSNNNNLIITSPATSSSSTATPSTTTIRVRRTKARTSSTRVRSLPALAAPRGCFRSPAACRRRRTAELVGALRVEPVPPEAFRPS